MTLSREAVRNRIQLVTSIKGTRSQHLRARRVVCRNKEPIRWSVGTFVIRGDPQQAEIASEKGLLHHFQDEGPVVITVDDHVRLDDGHGGNANGGSGDWGGRGRGRGGGDGEGEQPPSGGNSTFPWGNRDSQLFVIGSFLAGTMTLLAHWASLTLRARKRRKENDGRSVGGGASQDPKTSASQPPWYGPVHVVWPAFTLSPK